MKVTSLEDSAIAAVLNIQPFPSKAYLALRRSTLLFERTTAAPPTRNRQLGISIDLWLPKYQFCSKSFGLSLCLTSNVVSFVMSSED